MNKNLKECFIPNELNEINEDKSKEKESEKKLIQCKREGSITEINFIPKSIDNLKGIICPHCGGNEFDLYPNYET
jgi:hypothetical protein